MVNNANDSVEISQIQAVGDKIVIKQDMDGETYNTRTGATIYIPKTVQDERTTANTGVIINKGSKVTDFEVGQRVMFHKYVGYDLVRKDGERDQIYKVIPAEEIIAVVKDSNFDTNEISCLNNNKLG